MPLIGQIVYGGTLQPPMPSGLLSMIGEDSQHYVTGLTGPTTFGIGCAETESNVFTRTTAQWRVDLASFALGTSGTYTKTHVVPVPGTPYFFCLGYKFGADPLVYANDVVGVRYKITDPSTIVPDGAFAYQTDAGFNGGSNIPGHTGWGVGVVDGKCYVVCSTGTIGDLHNYLIELPLAGSDADLTPSSWNAFTTLLPWSFGQFNFAGSRLYYNLACIIDDPDGIGVLFYRDVPDIGSLSLLYTVVDPVAHTNTGSNNVASAWGLPFSDSGKDFAGNPGIGRDYYTAPYQGANGTVYWARGFSDDHQQCRVREYTLDVDGNPVAGDVTDFHFTDEALPSGLNQTLEFVMIYSEGADIVWMARSNRSYIFGSEANFNVTPPTVTYPDIEPPAEVIDDLPPADAVIETQRWLIRTGHIRKLGEIAVDDLRLTIKRGVGDTDFEPKIWARANRDNKGFDKWARKGLGKKGDRFLTITFGGFGTAKDWQFEVATTDECEIELRKLEILPTQLGY